MNKSFKKITANHEVIYPRYDPQKFVGRQWLVEEVAQFIKEPESRHLILVGEPGFGKSTFLAYLAEIWNCPSHFIRADNIRGVTGIDPRAFLLSIGTQLFQKYGDGIFEGSNDGTTKVTVGLSKGQAEVVGRVIEELHSPLPFLKQERDIDVKVGAALGKSRVIGERIVKLVNNALSLPVSTLLHIAVLQPLKQLAVLNPGEKVVVFVDALDEALQHPEPNILNVIPKATDPDYPKNLRLVMTSRHGDHLVAFRKEDQRSLDDNKSSYWDETLKDTRKYIESRINVDDLKEALSGISKEEVDSLLADIEDKSDGNFLYLYHYLNTVAEAIKSGATSLDDFPVPDDLDEIYRFFAVDRIRKSIPDLIRFSVEVEVTPEIRGSLEQINNIHGIEINDRMVILAAQDGNSVLGELFSIASKTGLRIIDPKVVLGQDMGAWEEKVLPVLGILAVAFDVLSREQLSSLTKVDVVYVDSILKNLIQFLDTIKIDTRNGYRIYHIDFAEYLLDKDRNRDFPIDKSRWHSQVADHYRLEFRNRWNECDEYGLDYTLNHLLNVDMSIDALEKAVSGLLTEGFINARVTRSGWHQPLVKDLYRLKDRLPLVVYEPCIAILGGSHRISLVNQEVLRLLIEVYRLAPYPPSPYSGSRVGSKDYIIETLLEAVVHHPRRAMLVLESLMEETADVQMKGVIALAMAETGDPSATEKLLDILFKAPEYLSKSTHSGHLRWCAADGLIALNEPESVSPLLKKFWEPRVSPWLRQQILYVLGRMQAPLPLEEKYRIIDTGLTLRQDCLPRVLDAVYLLAPSNGPSRSEWSQRYQPIILAGLGVGKAPEGITVKHWTNPVTIKRALTALGRIGNENALTPLDNFIEPMHKREKEGLLKDQEKRLLEAARRARKEIIMQWGN